MKPLRKLDEITGMENTITVITALMDLSTKLASHVQQQGEEEKNAYKVLLGECRPELVYAVTLLRGMTPEEYAAEVTPAILMSDTMTILSDEYVSGLFRSGEK